MTEKELLQLSSDVKARVFDKIVTHLGGAKDDGRRREQKRARVAIRKITQWAMEEVGDEDLQYNSIRHCDNECQLCGL